jgi:phage minor structural protein
MATMLNVYDRQTRKKTAVLQNAFDIVETHELNQIYLLSFSLPSTDEKNKFCLPRHFVRWGDDGELYRIKAPKTDENNVGVVTYECEHVITTLCDTIMFGSFDTAQYVSNLTTKSTIEWLLSKQQDWVLDVCDFSRKFEYLW